MRREEFDPRLGGRRGVWFEGGGLGLSIMKSDPVERFRSAAIGSPALAEP